MVNLQGELFGGSPVRIYFFLYPQAPIHQRAQKGRPSKYTRFALKKPRLGCPGILEPPMVRMRPSLVVPENSGAPGEPAGSET